MGAWFRVLGFRVLGFRLSQNWECLFGSDNEDSHILRSKFGSPIYGN